MQWVEHPPNWRTGNDLASTEDHYENLLAPVYLWMAGGMDSALAQGTRDIADFLPDGSADPVAIDLGAGFGMHAIPLARNGYAVTAIDTSATLLDQLKGYSQELNIQAINTDIRDFRRHASEQADLIVCMGDTITHLRELSDVEHLFEQITEALAPGGRLVVTFRDYTCPLEGDSRFISVRSDENRILTCFLEAAGEHMLVHDLLHEREHASWRLRVSSYRKLRISPRWMLGVMDRVGLTHDY